MAEIEVEIQSVRQAPVSNKFTLMLKDKTTERYLPIYIGEAQAFRIKQLLIGAPLSNQLEPNPLDNIPEDFNLISVVINKFKDNEFFAKLVLKRGEKTKHLRLQLTEAIIASVINEVPIFVSKAVFTKTGITI